jgi:enediyne biosynthesis protein E4
LPRALGARAKPGCARVRLAGRLSSFHWMALCSILLNSIVSVTGQPTITVQPNNQSVSLGAKVLLEVSATTTFPPIRFQWRHGDTELPAATNSFLLLTNIQGQDAGDYWVTLTDDSGSIRSRSASLDVDPTFAKVTSGSIVTNLATSLGCVWTDYDDDGFPDLYVTCGVPGYLTLTKRNLLYHNNRDGTFSQITTGPLVGTFANWRGCAWADYDNDGALDLFLTRVDLDGVVLQTMLFRNNGNGTFVQMSTRVWGNVGFVPGGDDGCLLADYDNDGFLDLFLARSGADYLFHNTGGGTFEPAPSTILSMFSDSQDSHCAAWGDYDDDGWPDLFVAVNNDPPRSQENLLLHNLQGNGFERHLGDATATETGFAPSSAWVDYDNDGWPDLFVCNGLNYAMTNALYHNKGNGQFSRITAEEAGSIVNDAAFFMIPAWGDYDNDGFLDVFITTADPAGGRNFLYHNNGNGTFTRILTGSPSNETGQSYGCAWGDYDNDGFLDLFASRGGGVAVAVQNLLYRNQGNSNGWLKVKLVGTASNRSAVGAKVRIRATIRNRTFWQMREVSTGDGFDSSPLTVHFGLGDATNVDIVRIEWPSGIIQTLTNAAPRQLLNITEHQQSFSSAIMLTDFTRAADGNVKMVASGSPGLRYVFQGSTNLVTWTKLGVRNNLSGSVEFVDTHLGKSGQSFYRVWVP